jgi:hypothetical protein
MPVLGLRTVVFAMSGSRGLGVGRHSRMSLGEKHIAKRLDTAASEQSGGERNAAKETG